MAVIGLGAAAALAKNALGIRMDPYGAYNFLVEIEGIIAGGFSEVSGLGVQTEVEPLKEGGVNDFEHQLPKGTKYSDITLKHGVTDLDLLWNWYRDVVDGKIKRKSGSIYILDDSGLPAMWWDFYEAFPKKWDGPTLNAGSTTVATETLVLAHHGLKKSAESQALSAIRGAASAIGIL